MTVHLICIRLHRYMGLATAGFLLIAGLTGSVLAFQHELDAWLNPALFQSAGQGQPMPAAQLIETIERENPRLRVVFTPLNVLAGESAHLTVRARLDPATGKLFELGFDELFADPVTGQVLGTRQWGSGSLERKNLIPLINRLHYSLLLPGQWGITVMGVIALVWALNSLAGFYLTLPMSKRLSQPGSPQPLGTTASYAPHRTWRQRWGIAWRIKCGASRSRFTLDLHRAGGLWLSATLLALAISAVSFNLREVVFEPILSLVSPLSPSPFDTRQERADNDPLEPLAGFAQVLSQSRQDATQRGWAEAPTSVFYNSAYGIYGIGFGDEMGSVLGPSYLYYDGGDAHWLGEFNPRAGTAGDVLSALQLPLHSGRIAGLAGRAVICLTGLAVAMLSITGVLIWSIKRRASRVRQSPSPQAKARADAMFARHPLPSILLCGASANLYSVTKFSSTGQIPSLFQDSFIAKSTGNFAERTRQLIAEAAAYMLALLLHLSAWQLYRNLPPPNPPEKIQAPSMTVALMAASQSAAISPPAPPVAAPVLPATPPTPPKAKPKPLPKPEKPIAQRLEKPKVIPRPKAHPNPPEASPNEETEAQTSPVTEAEPTTQPSAVAAAHASRPKPAAESAENTRFSQGAVSGYRTAYPAIARQQGWEGTATVKIHVSADGEIENVTLTHSSGHEVLDEYAVEAVKSARHVKPCQRGDTPVDCTFSQAFAFKLSKQ